MIYYYFEKLRKTENRYLYEDKIEIDIYLPQFKIGIEYYGIYFHNKERAKNTILENNGITLLCVKKMDSVVKNLDSENVFYFQKIYPRKILRPIKKVAVDLLQKIKTRIAELDYWIDK